MSEVKTATERLRELLDERGVEYEAERIDLSNYFTWGENDCYSYTEYPDGTVLRIWDCTPEQAIAATLGDDDMYNRDDVESAFVRGYSLGSLPIGADPRWDENRQTVDEHMADLGWVRKADAESTTTDKDSADLGHVREMSATLGSGECENVSGVPLKFTCSECEDSWSMPYDGFNYCPSCGKRIRNAVDA